MNFTYENQGTNTYLVYTVAPGESIDSMSLGMLTNNKIPGLAGTLFTQMDSTKYFKYNVSAHIPVSQFFAGAVNRKRLLGVFRGVVEAILSAEDYMIDESSILLDLEYIFADVSTCETVLICLPIEQEAKKHDLGAFFKNIMFSTQFDPMENCDYVARIINYLNSSPLFSLSDFSELLESIEKTGTAAAQSTQPVVTQSVQTQQTQADTQTLDQIQTQTETKTQTQVQTQQPVQSKQPVVSQSVEIPGAQGAGQAQADETAKKNAAAKGNETQTKSKGFSLFGSLFSSKSDKKETKAAAAKQTTQQSAKQMTKTTPAMSFEVPGQSNAPKTSFDVPGQAASTPAKTETPQTTAKKESMFQRVKMEEKKTVEQVSVAQQTVQSVQTTQTQTTTQTAAQEQSAGKPLNFGQTMVLGVKPGETTVLNGGAAQTAKPDPHLIRVKNNERIPLSKPSFRIGKERSYVDYFIGDNTAISRSHANIVLQDTEYYIEDTNSTNHTYVNGVMSPSGQKTKLSHGDTIRLANEDFEFRLY